jgi:hydrogenase maturation protease
MGVENTILIIGVGNEFRTDDGLGILAAREIRRRSYPGVEVTEAGGEGTALMESWKGHHCVMLVDAICSGTTRGAVHRIDLTTKSIPRGFFKSSSHTFGVSEAVEMARQLGQLPGILLLYGIEGCQFDTGTGLTNEVVRSIPRLLGLIEADIVRLSPQTHQPLEETHDAAGCI